MNNFPVAEVLANMERMARDGALCYVKYTCVGCGSRQTSDEANTWRQDGYVCSECNHLTKPTEINFMMVHTTPEVREKILASEAEEKAPR